MCSAGLALNEVQGVVTECYFMFTTQCLENHNCFVQDNLMAVNTS